jgi:hypothetical protein
MSIRCAVVLALMILHFGFRAGAEELETLTYMKADDEIVRHSC